jgi:predicted MPP superfamily phosphohydrolase
MNQVIITFNGCALILVAGELVWLSRIKSKNFVLAFIFLTLFLVLSTFFGAIFSPLDGFGKFQLLAWAMFLHYPLYLVGISIISRVQRRALFKICSILATCVFLIGFDAFILEPHWLEVSQITISSHKLQNPVRVVVIADLQTDNLRGYEEQVFELVKSKEADLILLAGDYLHFSERADEYLEAKVELNELMMRSQLEAPLGIYAVRGNVDWHDWTELFAGLPIETFEATSSENLDAIVITGLALDDANNPNLSVNGQDKFHIVLGHSPNFSLGQVDADLLIAGHTHGGQVQIPFLGPILISSKVPRSWASGVTEIEPGKYLVVSRGIGMERNNAPRVRFLCRPELLVIDLMPVDAK